VCVRKKKRNKNFRRRKKQTNKQNSWKEEEGNGSHPHLSFFLFLSLIRLDTLKFICREEEYVEMLLMGACISRHSLLPRPTLMRIFFFVRQYPTVWPG
jgi:hypothetical protein